MGEEAQKVIDLEQKRWHPRYEIVSLPFRIFAQAPPWKMDEVNPHSSVQTLIIDQRQVADCSAGGAWANSKPLTAIKKKKNCSYKQVDLCSHGLCMHAETLMIATLQQGNETFSALCTPPKIYIYKSIENDTPPSIKIFNSSVGKHFGDFAAPSAPSKTGWMGSVRKNNSDWQKLKSENLFTDYFLWKLLYPSHDSRVWCFFQ